MDIAGRDPRATALRRYSKLNELQVEDRAKLRGLLRAIDLFAVHDENMPLQRLRAFLLVATEEGLGTAEYSKKADVADRVMSRHLSELGEFSRSKRGHDLVYQNTDPEDRRNRKAYLTSQGHALGQELVEALRR